MLKPIKASDAKAMSETGRRTTINRQIEMINKAIKQEAAQGKTSHDCAGLEPEVYKALEEAGYKVERHVADRLYPWETISWH